MVARLRAWWQHNKKPLEIIGVTLFLIGLLSLIVLIIVGYIYNWAWVGIGPNAPSFQHGKTLWDWLQLLIIPAVLAIGGYVFNLTVSRNERQAAANRDKTEREAATKRDQTEVDIAADNQQEAALQSYIDKMSELLLDKKLRESADGEEVRNIARVRTLTVLPRLDEYRKQSVLQFLYESGLIHKDKPIIVLDGADLSDANLWEANLSDANLSRAFLFRANLNEANLGRANLSRAGLLFANLSRANLIGANLSGTDATDANLSGAYLGGADLFEADLRGTDLSGADLSVSLQSKLMGKLSETNLVGANLTDANLTGANLSGANLVGALVTPEQLDTVKSLKGATMLDGSIHP